MEKNWLIRTVEKRVLGPASREKVLELLRKGSLREDDELCTGNGYWFFVRERELVDTYLIKGQNQGFNPIAEGQTVLVKEDLLAKEKARKEQEEVLNRSKKSDGSFIVKFPKNNDLEYPDPNEMNLSSRTDGTVVFNRNDLEAEKGINASGQSIGGSNSEKKSSIQNDNSGIFFPESEDLEYPDLEMDKLNEEELKKKNVSTQKQKVEAPVVKAPDVEKLEEYKTKRKKKKKKETYHNNRGNNNLLYLLIVTILAIGIAGYYYFKTGKFRFSDLNPIGDVYAQSEDLNLIKKKE